MHLSPQCLLSSLVVVSAVVDLGDTCIKKLHFGTYIVGYTVENLVLR